MKRNTTLQKFFTNLLLVFILTFTHSISKAITYQIGTGTTTNTQKPIYSCYGYNYSQQIYTLAELNAAGASGSQIITAIRFFYASGGTTTTTWNNWTVFIGNTAQASFSGTTNWISTASMTQVFSGTIAPVAGTWVTITLSTPFVWNGTSNLVVAVDENSASYSCTAAWRSYTGVTGNRSMLYYSDITNPNPAAPPAANSAPTTINAQIQFEMNAAVACSGTPTPGTSAISSASGCSGTSFTLSNTGASSGSGISYQWQSSASAGGPWSNIGGATNTTYTTTAATTTYYRLVTTCSNSGLSNSSNVVSYTVAGTSCTYTFRLTDSYGDGWNGASMQLRIGTTVIATFGASFTTGTQLDIPQALCGGTTYNLYYVGSGSYPTEVGIQILNNANAVIYTLGAGAGSVGTQLYSWTASCPSPPSISGFSPTTACGGSTPVTITGTNFTGTTAVTFGGVAAQSFTVVNATTITALPGMAGASGNVAVTNPSGTATLAGFSHLTAPTLSVSSIPASALLCGAGGNVQLTASGTGSTYTWNPGGLSGAIQTFSPASTTIYTVTSSNGTCNSTMTKLVTVAPLPTMTSLVASPSSFCDQGNAFLSVTPGLPTAVCVPTVSSAGASGDYISNVNFNAGIINNTTGDAPLDYTDYAALVATVTAGSTYNISVTTGPTYSQGKGVYIDYNKNGVFTDAGEFVWSAPSAIGIASGSFTIPASASSGVVRMRVVCYYVTQPTSANSCNIAGFGEYEDYRLDISGGTGLQPILAYAWSPATFLSTTTGTTTNANSVNTTTTYTVQATDAIGCTATSSVTVTVNPLPTLSVATTPSPATVCAGYTVTLTASGNASSYSWTDGTNTPANGTAFTPVASSVYTVTATSASGCTTTDTVSVTVNPLPTLSVSSTPSPATVCAGNSVTLTASGNAASYTWTDGTNTPANGSAFTPAASSVYTVTATSADGCTTTATTAVTVNSLPVLTTSSSPAPCNGGSGSINFSASGNGAMVYTVNGNPQSSPYAASAGTYTVAATDVNGCSASSTEIVSEPSALSISITKSSYNGADLSCATATDGGFTANVSGGTLSYTYSLNGGAYSGINTFSSLAAGVYTITVMDANNCSLSTTVSIVAPPALQLSLSATNALCNTGNGSLNFSTTGGTGAVTYTVNGNPQASPFATPAGNYTVVATDANGCSASSTAVITQPLTGVVVSVLAFVDPTCSSSGVVVVSGTGGTGALTYSVNPTIGTQVVSGTFSGLTAQAYTMTATDANGCTATTQITLLTPPLPTVSVTSATPILCNGGTSTITVNGSGGAPAYTYSLNGGAYVASNVFSGNTAGVYNISVKDANNCTGTTSLTIVQPTSVSVSASASAITCFGGSATITASAAGGTAGYQYQLNAGGFQPMATFNGVTAGTYTITAQDANGCTATATLSVTQPVAVTAIIVSSVNVSCNGGSNGSATALGGGGTGPYTYLWSNLNPTATAGSLSAGSYTVTVTDAGGCTATSSVNISQPAVVNVNITSLSAACNGGNGSLSFSATGGSGTFTYTVNGTSQVSPFAAPQGIYTVVATDGSGCTASSTATVTQPAGILVTATPGSILCNGGNTTLSVSATGGTGAFQYSLNGGALQAGTLFSNLIAGTYTVTAFDANNCSAATVATISQPADLVISTISPTSCPNQSLILSASVSGGTPGYTYLWDVLTLNGGSLGANTPFNNDGINHGESTSSTFTNPDFDTHQIGNGLYGLRIVVTDLNGCKDTAFFNITVQNGPNTTISASTAGAVCLGDTVTYSVPVIAGNGSYAWTITNGTVTSGGGNTNTVTVAWNNAATPNTVGVTVNQNGCIATNTVNVTVNPTPVLIITNPAPVCAPSTVDLTVPAVTAGSTPGLTLTYHTNAGATLPYLTPTTATTGTYYIKGSDALGCKAVQPVSVTVNPQPVLTASATNATCNGANGSLTFSATGTPTITYTVNGTAQSSPYAAPAGTYTVVASDGVGCSASTVLPVTAPAAITLTASATNALCNAANGSLSFSAVGGTGSISYTVNGSSQVSPFVASAGTYTIVATDANLCSVSTTVTITEPAAIVLTAGSSNPLCNAANGQLTFSATGGSGTILFTVNGAAQSSPFNVAAGTYTIVATDANLCSTSTVQTVSAPTAVVLTASASNALCNGNNGSLNLSASGGTGSITYTINGNAATAGSNALPAGTYTVIAMDANSCSASTVLTITQPAALSIGSPVTLQSGCFGTTNGIFQLIGTTGGSTPYTYSSSPILSQPIAGTFTGVTNGSVYTITAADVNNCAMTTTVLLGNPQVIVTASSTLILCNGGSSDITALATGGTGTFTYSLNGGTSQATGIFAANLPGNYTVVAVDGNSCSNSTTLSISQPAALTLSATATSPICSGGNGTLDFLAGGGTAGYTYTVNGTSATSPYSTVAGTYTIVATDANACSVSTVLTMSSPTPVTVTATSTAASVCLGGSVTFTAVGNGASYAWTDGINTPTDGVAFTPPSTGTSTYTVTATSGACTATATINLTVHGVGSFTAPITLTAACPEAPGSSITIGSTGAAAPVSYSIEPNYPTSPIPGIFNGLIGGASYTITLSDANGCSASTTLNAPAAFANGELANAGVANIASTPGNSCKGQNQPDGAAMSFYGADCHDLIAKVDDANGGNVLGNVNACVTVTPGVQTYNGQPYIRRSYVITPQNQGPATLTFYFTLEDITGYNANAGSYPQISIPGPLTNGSTISFLCSQVPQNLLPGAPGANTILHNVTATWNASVSRWEAVIPVTGFSGFYFHTGSLPLPVTINRFEGRKQANGNLLEWTTSSEQNNAYFNLQHSTNGNDFSTIAKVNSQALNGNSSTELNYSFQHTKPAAGHNYYRLQQVDLDDQQSMHAKVIDLMWGADGNSISLYPNPTLDVLHIELYSIRVTNTVVKVLDMSGRVVKQVQARTEAGMNKLSLSLGELSSGIYTIQVYENDHLSFVSKVKKTD